MGVVNARSQQQEQSKQPERTERTEQPLQPQQPQQPRNSATSTQTSWWKVFAKPSWIILALSLIAFSILAFTVLAPWQLNKDDEIVDRNERIQQAYEQDPVPFAELVDAFFAEVAAFMVLNSREKMLTLRPFYCLCPRR